LAWHIAAAVVEYVRTSEYTMIWGYRMNKKT